MKTFCDTQFHYKNKKENIISRMFSYLEEKKLLRHEKAQNQIKKMRANLDKENQKLHDNFIANGGTKTEWENTKKVLIKNP